MTGNSILLCKQSETLYVQTYISIATNHKLQADCVRAAESLSGFTTMVEKIADTAHFL